MTDDPNATEVVSTANPPGQSVLRRRATVHGASMARMRAQLAAPESELALRSLARQPTDDPSVALLDAWAVVADVVAFYSERVATEGFLRTATERGSVRELARTLGYELRPGVSAQVELAFSAETAPGAPEVVSVERGTPVQSVPLQDQLPQTFETSDDLEVRGAWNAIPVIASEPQTLPEGTSSIWLSADSTTVRRGASILIVASRGWDFRVVEAVMTAPDGFTHWVRLDLDRPIFYRPPSREAAELGVFLLPEQTHLFGWNAPDPNLMLKGEEDRPPPGTEVDPEGPSEPPRYRWVGYGVVDDKDPRDIEVDGEHEQLLPGTWVVLEQGHEEEQLTWAHDDLWKPHGVAAAAGDPHGYVFAAEGREHVVYRGTDGHIYEYAQTPGEGWWYADLSAISGATAASGDPYGFTFETDSRQYVVYRGTDNHIHELSHRPSERWSHENLTADLDGMPAAGDARGYVFETEAERRQHVVYRGTDNHVYELARTPEDVWWYVDLTVRTRAPVAAGDPHGYAFESDLRQFVIFRGINGHIHQLSHTPGAHWSHVDVTARTGAPPAAGDPYGYVFEAENREHIIYRGTDGHIHELRREPGEAWAYVDLSLATGAPAAAGDPSAYAFEAEGRQHIVYRGADDRIHELAQSIGEAWGHFDLSEVTYAPVPTGRPRGFASGEGNRQHVLYRGVDQHIHELAHPSKGRTQLVEACRVVAARPDGAAKFALSGRLTRVTADISGRLAEFSRRRALVHCSSVPLPADDQPRTRSVSESNLLVELTDPPLPAGRTVLINGFDAESTLNVAESAVVTECTPTDGSPTMTITIGGALAHGYRPQGLVVHANVVTATHGETVEQVLGSGDGRTPFAQFRPRRSPLTYVRSTSADGASADLTVRVDGVEWKEVANLDDAGPTDRVFVVHQEEYAPVSIVLGDGVHGARPPTGAENIHARYRVGIGEPGAVVRDQVSLLARRPLGIREVTNPAPAHDWAPAETLEQARLNAPLRVRTLDRAVSVLDHEDFAAGYAGVGAARADLIWDGRSHVVLVTVLGIGATVASPQLVSDVERSLKAARDPGTTLGVKTGLLLPFGIEIAMAHDPLYERPAVENALSTKLVSSFGASARHLGAPITSAEVLVAAKDVPGVLACTMPWLSTAWPAPHALPPGPDEPKRTYQEGELLVAAPGSWDGSKLVAAELLALQPEWVQLDVMTT